MDPPIFITCRDRVVALRELVAWLERAGHQRIILVDNDSEYEPLREYLKASPHKVVWCDRNWGARALWEAELAPVREHFVLSDPDVVPTDDCPLDAVNHLHGLLREFPRFRKAGLGLYLDDVPESMGSLDWERELVAQHRQIDAGVFDSLVDTTFALYRPGSKFDLTAIRTGHPYQARHSCGSWYGGDLTDEDRFYLERATAGPLGSSWKEAA